MDIILLSLILLIIYLIYYLCNQNSDVYKFWQNINVPHLKGYPVFGSAANILLKRLTNHQFTLINYNHFKNEPFFGMYFMRQPILVVKDLELIKKIAIKDSDIFVNRANLFLKLENDKFFGNSLFGLKGQKWKEIRGILSPAFTSSKMKFMFNLVDECTDVFVDFYKNKLKNVNSIEIEMKEMFTRIANDMIDTCMFGIKVDSLNYPNNKFYQIGQLTTNINFWRVFGVTFFPRLMKLLGEGLFSNKLNSFFYNLVKTSIEKRDLRKKVRNDMIQLLMEARDGQLKLHEIEKEKHYFQPHITEISHHELHPEFELDYNLMASQVANFLFAGFDTTSIVLSFATYELAKNQDVQDKLRYEILTKLNENNKITYDDLNKILYLNMVISETMRMYPVLVSINRSNVKEYKFKNPKNDTEIILPPNSHVQIPVYGIHFDPDHFPQPHKFDPERFRDENNIKPGSFLPFGIGPRNCIGSRFGLMMVKITLIKLLTNFKIDICRKTEIPINYAKHPFKIIAKNGIWLKLSSIELTRTK